MKSLFNMLNKLVNNIQQMRRSVQFNNTSEGYTMKTVFHHCTVSFKRASANAAHRINWYYMSCHVGES